MRPGNPQREDSGPTFCIEKSPKNWRTCFPRLLLTGCEPSAQAEVTARSSEEPEVSRTLPQPVASFLGSALRSHADFASCSRASSWRVQKSRAVWFACEKHYRSTLCEEGPGGSRGPQEALKHQVNSMFPVQRPQGPSPLACEAERLSPTATQHDCRTDSGRCLGKCAGTGLLWVSTAGVWDLNPIRGDHAGFGVSV